MKKFMAMSLVMGLSSMALASDVFPPKSFKKINCRKEVKAELTKSFANSKTQWEKIPDFNFDTQAFRSPTTRVGDWYELRMTEKAAPTLIFYSSKEMRETHWDAKCKASVQTSAGVDFGLKADAQAFTDASLAEVMATKKPALIYTWSPRMVYSVTEFNRAKALAEKRNMQFIPLLDPMVDVAEAKAAMKKAGLEIQVKMGSAREPSSVDMFKQIGSVDLYMRNGTLHFPSMFLVSNGKIHSRRLVGVMTSDDINQSLDEMTKDLK